MTPSYPGAGSASSRARDAGVAESALAEEDRRVPVRFRRRHVAFGGRVGDEPRAAPDIRVSDEREWAVPVRLMTRRAMGIDDPSDVLGKGGRLDGRRGSQ